MEQRTNESVFALREILEADAYQVLGVAPYVLRGAVAHAAMKEEDMVTMSQVKRAVQAFLQAPAK